MVHGTPHTWFSFGESSVEWDGNSYLRPAFSTRRLAMSSFLVMWIALLDFAFPRTNFSVLYVVPLILMARAGQLRHVRHAWIIAGALIFLTYGIYVLKNVFNPAEVGATLLDYRLVNRTLVALMVLAMCKALQSWDQRRRLQAEPELSESFRHEEQEIGGTFAILGCMALVVLIAIGDYFLPANINIAILYPIPLFVCGFANSRRMLWAMLGILLILTTIMFVFGSPATGAGHEFSMVRNRVLAACSMIVVTLVLDFWMTREGSQSDDSTGSII